MASQADYDRLHFVLIPLMSQGHLIPMTDMAKLLAQRGVTVTIVTTPLNAIRFSAVTDRAVEAGLPIRVLKLRFPSVEAGLPEGCESAEAIPTMEMWRRFFVAVGMLQQQFEDMLTKLQPRPNCIVADRLVVWATDTASKFKIPRIIFDAMSCFTFLCSKSLHISRVHEGVPGSASFVMPGLPDRVEFTREQLPMAFNNPGLSDLKDFQEKKWEAELGAYGVVVNSFEELEPEYFNEYRKMKGGRVWCVGPLSLYNKDSLDKAERGNKNSIDERQCLKWLDSWSAGSVVYACLGSFSGLTAPQMLELGLGLEAANRPFVWVVRGDKAKELEEWIVEDGLEERTKGRWLLIRGWAPQVLILSHPAIGAFLTHCGWNSSLEGVSAGLPLITWPLFSDQFFNEKLIVEVLEIGASVGAEIAVQFCEEEKSGVLVRREAIRQAVERVMGGGKEAGERRRRARELGEMAKRAVEEGGSSQLSMTLLIQDIMKQAKDGY